MISLPSNQQQIHQEGNIAPEWNSFFQQVKTTIKNDLSVDIGVPSVLQPIVNDSGNIDRIWYSFFEKSYSATGATFGIPSIQDKENKNWYNFFRNLYEELK